MTDSENIKYAIIDIIICSNLKNTEFNREMLKTILENYDNRKTFKHHFKELFR